MDMHANGGMSTRPLVPRMWLGHTDPLPLQFGHFSTLAPLQRVHVSGTTVPIEPRPLHFAHLMTPFPEQVGHFAMVLSFSNPSGRLGGSGPRELENRYHCIVVQGPVGPGKVKGELSL